MAFSVTGRELFTYTSAVGFAIALPILPSFSAKRGHFVRGRRYRDTEIGEKEKERRDGRTSERPCGRDDRPTTIRLLTPEKKGGRGSDEK